MSEAIGPEGGSISLEDGFHLYIPAGALASSVDITVEKWETSIPYAAGPAYLLGPEGLTFDVPVTLELPVDNEDIPSDTKQLLTAYWAPKGIESFNAVEQVTVEDSLVRTETTHFSVWMAGSVRPTVLAQAERFPRGIATDGTDVYWANGGNLGNQLVNTNQGYIARAPIGGGAVQLLTPPQEDPNSVAVNGTHVYWTNAGDGIEFGGGITGSAVMRVAKSGGVPEQLAPAQFAVGLALDATYVYYTDADLGEVSRIPLDGGAPTTIAVGQGVANNIVVDDTYAVWTSESTGRVVAYNKLSGTLSVLASNQVKPAGVAVRDGFVYWVNAGDGRVSKVPASGGSVDVLRTAKSPTAIAVAADNVIYTDLGDSRVYSVKTSGGNATLLAKDQWIPWNLTELNGTVLWSNAGLYVFEGTIAGMSF